MTDAPPPAATPPPEPAGSSNPRTHTASVRRMPHEPQITDDDLSTPAPEASGETRAALSEALRLVDHVLCSSCQHDAAEVLAAPAPGPDTARDGEVIWRDQSQIAWEAEYQARRELGEFKTAVERLCDAGTYRIDGSDWVSAPDLRALLTDSEGKGALGDEGGTGT